MRIFSIRCFRESADFTGSGRKRIRCVLDQFRIDGRALNEADGNGEPILDDLALIRRNIDPNLQFSPIRELFGSLERKDRQVDFLDESRAEIRARVEDLAVGHLAMPASSQNEPVMLTEDNRFVIGDGVEAGLRKHNP